ncbi:MAG: hypothetical protein WBA35_04745 [Litorimonas sp.]
MKTAGLVAGLTALAACATTGSADRAVLVKTDLVALQEAASVAPDPQDTAEVLPMGDLSEVVVCRYERPTGSRFKVKMCQTVVEQNTARQAAQRDLNRFNQESAVGCFTGSAC